MLKRKHPEQPTARNVKSRATHVSWHIKSNVEKLREIFKLVLLDKLSVFKKYIEALSVEELEELSQLIMDEKHFVEERYEIDSLTTGKKYNLFELIIKTNQIRMMKYLLSLKDSAGRPLLSTSADSHLYLQTAVLNGCLKMVNLLLTFDWAVEKSTQVNELKFDSDLDVLLINETALSLALQYGYTEIMAALLKVGVIKETIQAEEGRILYAALHGDNRMFRLIVQNWGSIDEKLHNLFNSALSRHPDKACILLKKFPDLASEVALRKACLEGHVKLVKALLQRPELIASIQQNAHLENFKILPGYERKVNLQIIRALEQQGLRHQLLEDGDQYTDPMTERITTEETEPLDIADSDLEEEGGYGTDNSGVVSVVSQKEVIPQHNPVAPNTTTLWRDRVRVQPDVPVVAPQQQNHNAAAVAAQHAPLWRRAPQQQVQSEPNTSISYRR